MTDHYIERNQAKWILASEDLLNLSSDRQREIFDGECGDEQREPSSEQANMQALLAVLDRWTRLKLPSHDTLYFCAIDVLASGYSGCRTEYIEARLLGLNVGPHIITGNPEPLVRCPCCDYFTLVERGQYDVCRVCFWEDSGLSDLDRFSSPNRMTLRQARLNFERFFACDERAARFLRVDRLKMFVQ